MMADKHCQKCGAVLPDEDEGLCPVCGTPFGARTMAIEVTPELLAAEFAKAQASAQPQPAEPPEAAAATVPSMRRPDQLAPPDDGPPKALVAGFALIVSAIVLVVVWLVIL